jgi:hypothetical protein
MSTRYASRKFLLAAASLASANWLAITAVITPVVYQGIVLGTVGAYIIGNVWQKNVDKKASATQEAAQ